MTLPDIVYQKKKKKCTYITSTYLKTDDQTLSSFEVCLKSDKNVNVFGF
jgi:hypothetical protein